MSAVNVGLAEVAPARAAALPAGLLVRVHEYVRESLFASELALPSKVTVIPVSTLCTLPAFATGAAFAVAAVTVTLAALLFSAPSLTTRFATYEPGISATNVGLADAGS